MKPVITDNDERGGLPSASIIERLALCPGSLRASKGLPEILSPEMKRYAETGDRVHLYCEAPDFIDLTNWPDELEVGQKCLKIRDDLIQSIFGKSPSITESKETRLWLYGLSSRIVKLFSGKSDYTAHDDKSLLVVDYKSGRGDQEDASSNLQLRSLLVLKWIDLGRPYITGYTAIIQPLVSHKPEVCKYDPESLPLAEQEIRAVLDFAGKSHAPIVAGERQCRFCPARLKCPAAGEVLQQIANEDVTKLLGIDPKDMATLLDRCDTAETIIKAARSHAKAHLKLNPSCIPGWTLTPNAPTRHIEDAEGAFNAMLSFGVTSEMFLKQCVTVKIGGLEKAAKEIAEKRGDKCSAKMAKDIVNTNCKKFITEKPKEPSLERVKEVN